jgi:uroporphyrinogen-III decarboxylase
MAETMTCYERVEAAWNLKQADRVPVAPLVIYILPYLAGLSFHEILSDPEKLVQAAIDHSDLVGDNIHPLLTVHDHHSLLPNTGWERTTLHWRIWDQFPPKGNIPSSYFDKVIFEDYEDVMRRGFAQAIFNKHINPEMFERSIEDWLYDAFEYPIDFWNAWRRFVSETGKALMFGSRATIPLDYLIYCRTFGKITEDVTERPEQVKALCEIIGEYEIMRAMAKCMQAGAGEVPGAENIFLQMGLSGPPYISPSTFDEFVYPTMKKQVDLAVGRGFKVHFHLDGDMTLVLDRLRHIVDGLPKGRVLLDFEKTNMRKAKEILGDRVCIYGNVPAALMVYGSTEEVDSYCQKLIKDCAEGGGFILGTECEVPWDAKPDNVRAMIAAAKKYGEYS